MACSHWQISHLGSFGIRLGFWGWISISFLFSDFLSNFRLTRSNWGRIEEAAEDKFRIALDWDLLRSRVDLGIGKVDFGWNIGFLGSVLKIRCQLGLLSSVWIGMSDHWGVLCLKRIPLPEEVKSGLCSVLFGCNGTCSLPSSMTYNAVLKNWGRK